MLEHARASVKLRLHGDVNMAKSRLGNRIWPRIVRCDSFIRLSLTAGQMSGLGKENRACNRRASSEKPRHVKKLDFGYSVLQVNTVDALCAQHGRVLVFDEHIARIPCTVKKDFVEKWLETHDYASLIGDENQARDSSSPILKGRTANNCESQANIIDARVTTSSPTYSESSGGTVYSPVLSRRLQTAEKIQRNALHSSRLDECQCPMVSPQNSNAVTTYLSHKRKRAKDDNEREDGPSKVAAREKCTDSNPNLRMYKNLSDFCALRSHTGGSIENTSQEGKESLQIETGSSNGDSYDNYGVPWSINGKSDETRSDLIEDTDSHDRAVVAMPLNSSVLASTLSDVNLVKNKSGPWTRDVHLSENISHDTSSTTEILNSKLYRIDSDITSTTSPPKTTPDAMNYASLLDSGKKRRKPKKGSLLAKLRSMISSEKSFMRIWQHRTKQGDFGKICVPFIEIHVKTCATRFNKQFLEGVVMEDSLDPLKEAPRVSNISTFPSPVHGSYVGRCITIMILPDVVGSLEIKCGYRVKIYPPWDVLDSVGILINARKISAAYGDIRTFIHEPMKEEKRRTCLRTYECVCTKEGELNKGCTKLHDNAKPNTMELVLNA